MNNSFIHLNNYPPIYKISLDNHEELLSLYSDILKNVPTDEVTEKMVSYVSSTIEPVDWKGIWRTRVTVTPRNGSPFGHSSSASALDQTVDRSSSVLADRSSGEQEKYVKCDFEVEVIDVSRSNLTAIVVVRNLLSPTLDTLTTASFDAINDFLSRRKVRTVQLTDLYVISEGDMDEHLLPTALVIEQVRFFYKYIWRPYDDVIQSDLPKDIFIQNKNRLETRLTFYFDVKNKLISDSIINKIHHLIEEGRKLRSKLDFILSKNERPDDMDMNTGLTSESNDCGVEYHGNNRDMDSFMDESDLYQMMKLKVKLEDIEREMKLLEDPFLRSVSTCINSKQYNDDTSEQEEEEEVVNTVDTTFTWKRSEEKIHVLCKRVTAKELDLVNERIKNGGLSSTVGSSGQSSNGGGQSSNGGGQSISPDAEILFYKKLNRIISSPTLKDGDRVLILPGVHVVDSLPWIDHDVTIEGLTQDPKDVVLQASNLIGDIFINCSSNAVTVSNVTLRTVSDTHAIVMVHSGSTDLINCTIEGHKSKFTIVSLSKADVVLDNCCIKSDLEDQGIVRKCGSNLTIDGKQVASTLDDDDDDDFEPNQQTGLKVTPSKNASRNVQFMDEKILNTLSAN